MDVKLQYDELRKVEDDLNRSIIDRDGVKLDLERQLKERARELDSGELELRKNAQD
jgi:hypothetical protein